MTTTIASLTLTAVLLLGSPGPAPIALAASGATFGWRRSLAFYVGVVVGLVLAASAAAAGLGALFAAFPSVRRGFEIVAALYILYLAYRIATTTTPRNAAHPNGAPRFRDGVLLNVLNPKSYAVFLAIYSQSMLPVSSTVAAYGLTALVCIAVASLTNGIWLSAGQLFTSLFRRPRSARIIRTVLALMMVGAVFWAIFG